MTTLELNIEEISRLSKQNENENFKFRSFLKGQDSNNIDKIVHRIYNEIIGLVDCTDCANCCKQLRICLTYKDINRLSKLENLSPEEYEANYIVYDNFAGKKCLRDNPCRYLSDNKCIIYSNRPVDCKSYPYIHKRDFVSRAYNMIDYLGICPIVFNVFERLKVELRFKK